MNKRAKLIKSFEKIIDDKFNACDITKHKRLFLSLEKWAREDLNDECCDIFLEALYNAKSTQDTRILLAVERGVSKILESEKR